MAEHFDTKHFNIEDMEKYVAEDFSEGYLTWLEQAEAHLNECEICREKLRRFMLVDVVTNEFYTMALPGMQQIQEAAREEAEKKSIAERLLIFFEGTELAQEARCFAASLKEGMTQTLFKMQESMTLPPCVVRGGGYEGERYLPQAYAVYPQMANVDGRKRAEDESDRTNRKLRGGVSEAARETGARVEYSNGKLHVCVALINKIQDAEEVELLLCYKTAQGEQFAIAPAKIEFHEIRAVFDIPEQVEEIRIYTNKIFKKKI